MRKALLECTLFLLPVLLLLVGLFGLKSLYLVRLNKTASVPVGAYRLLPDVSPVRGDFVSACLPAANPYLPLATQRNYLPQASEADGMACPANRQPLLKVLAGIAGDTVQITGNGIIINGKLLHNSVIKPRDTRNRSLPTYLPAYSGVIPQGKALLLSTYSPDSFDGRYFGLVDRDTLIKAVPLITF